jgi:S1/P1 Nuclease
MKNIRRCSALMVLWASLGISPVAQAWGCQGHEIVALLAEQHLNPHARATVAQILAASPVSPELHRFCRESGLDPFVDSSTWADDERSIRPDTAGWHFIDIPRGAPRGELAPYCLPPAGCLTRAIAEQLAVLGSAGASPQARAEALRYIIHFVGDLHQPLHTTTNDDRGGNCVPVRFFDRAPEQTNAAREDYRPNLHGIWDTDIIEHFAHGQRLEQMAEELESQFQSQMVVWQSQPVDVAAWAWESHQVAEDVAYGDLPTPVAVETPRPVNSCADDDHISLRMLKLNEQIGEQYQRAAEAAIQQQLAKAGARLAAVLNSLWP